MTLTIYKVTANFPKTEHFGIVSQIRRASVSISTNIVEGAAMKGHAGFRRYLAISFASASEVEYLLLLSYELKYLSKDDFEDLTRKTQEIKMMLVGLIKGLS